MAYALDPGNIISNGGTLTLSNNDRTVLNTGTSAYETIIATTDTSKTTGVWRWEFEHTGAPAGAAEDLGYGGIQSAAVGPLAFLGSGTTGGFALYENGTLYNDTAVFAGTTAALTSGDVISFVVDLDTPASVIVEIFLNGASQTTFTQTRTVSGEAWSPAITQRSPTETPTTRFKASEQTQPGVGGQALVDDVIPQAAIAGEDYTTAASINNHPEWIAGSALTCVAATLLPNGPVGERWFQGASGANNNSHLKTTTFTFPALAGASTQNEFEVSAAFKSDSLINSQTLFTLHHGTTIDTWTSARRHADNTWDIYQDIPGGSNSVILASGLDGGVAAADVFYMTLRLKGATSALTDGVIELWINSVLIYQNNAVDFRDDERLEGNMQAEMMAWQADAKVKNAVALDSWSSAPSSAPKVYKVTDNGSFDETVEEVTLDYYVVPVEFPFALAGEGYANAAAIDAHPEWRSAAVGCVPTQIAFLPNGPVGETWFFSPEAVSSADQRLSTELYTYSSVPDQDTFEASAAYRLVSTGSLGAGQADPIIHFRYGSDTGTFNVGFNSSGIITVQVDATAAVANLQTVDISNGRTVYLTLRVKSETTSVGGDGEIEVYANGILIHKETGLTLAAARFAESYWYTGGGRTEGYAKNFTIVESWSTADSVAPTPVYVTDDGSFTETITPTTLAYYISTIQAAIAGEGYTNAASIAAHPDWGTVFTVNAELQTFLPVATAPVNERWFLSANSGTNRFRADNYTPTNEFEISFAHRPNVLSGPDASIIEFSGAYLLETSGFDGRIKFGAHFNFGGGTDFGTIAPAGTLEDGKINYIVFRMRGETNPAGGSDDGRVELFINGEMVFQETGSALHNDNTRADLSAITEFEIGGGTQNGQSAYYKNVVIKDTWSTAPGIVPTVLKVTDNGSFTESVEETTIDYYLGSIVLGAIGGDGYVTEADITSNAANNFTVRPGGSITPTPLNFLPVTVAGEKWFASEDKSSSSDQGLLHYTGTEYNSAFPAGQRKFIEMSFAFRHRSGAGGGFGRIMDIQFAGGSDFAIRTDTTTGELIINPSAATNQPSSITLASGLINIDQTAYITLRFASETSSGALATDGGDGDGYGELWVDGVLVHSFTNIIYHSTVPERTMWATPGVSVECAFIISRFNQHYGKNATVLKEWSSAQTVKPPAYRVTDLDSQLVEVPYSYYGIVEETVTVQLAEISESESISPPHYDDGATDQANPVVKVASVSTSESISPPHYDEAFVNQTTGVVRLSDIQTSESIEVQPAFYNIVIVNTSYLTSPIIGVI